MQYQLSYRTIEEDQVVSKCCCCNKDDDNIKTKLIAVKASVVATGKDAYMAGRKDRHRHILKEYHDGHIQELYIVMTYRYSQWAVVNVAYTEKVADELMWGMDAKIFKLTKASDIAQEIPVFRNQDFF